MPTSNYLGIGTASPATTLDVNGIVRTRVQSLNYTDGGGGGGSGDDYTLTPTASYAEANCQGTPSGTNITLGETGAQQGQLLTIVSIGSQNCVIVDSAGVAEVSAAANVTLGQYDSMTLIYMSDRWIRLSTGDN